MNKTINVSIPKTLTDLAEEQVKAGYYSSISEVVRDALRRFLILTNVPVFPLSEKAEKIALQGLEEHRRGKSRQVASFKELGN